MNKVILILLCLAVASCTKEKTDYNTNIDVPILDEQLFKVATVIHTGDYDISIEALDGIFYTGYNEIRLKVKNRASDTKVKASAVHFLPTLRDTHIAGLSSCPHQYVMDEKEDGSFWGYVVFTAESTTVLNWSVDLSFTVDGKVQTVKQAINVKAQVNKNRNMTAFTANDGTEYVIALRAPVKPKIGENELIASIYKHVKPIDLVSADFPESGQFTYPTANGYTLLLDPRMPDPSMGNHSSLNNKDLKQKSDGLYYGVVNYTMTGNWTLNFILLNPEGKILKGTVVPNDFTPGVAGKKSDLFIDILF